MEPLSVHFGCFVLLYNSVANSLPGYLELLLLVFMYFVRIHVFHVLEDAVVGETFESTQFSFD